MQTTMLSSIVVIFGLSILVLFACYRLRIPTIVGFLLTGILAGPSGLRLVQATQDVEMLAQIGVVLLLFSIGIEFSLKQLLSIKKIMLLGGTLQVVLTIIVIGVIALQIGKSPAESIFMGFLLSLSSTAIVLKRLQEKAEVESPHGKISLGILIYQDLIAVPMMLLVPFLSGNMHNLGTSIGLLCAKLCLIVLVLVLGVKWIVPGILFQAAKTRSREIFLLTIIVICFSVAWLTSTLGLSIALGAFLAGLIISESEFSYQALGSILPFRDVFTSIFFISIGMLFDVGYFIKHPALIALVSCGVLAIKSIIAGTASGLIGFPLRTMVLVGLALGQVGEFSFILMQAGFDSHIIDRPAYNLFLGVSILTMAMTPLIMGAGNWLTCAIMKLPLPARLKSGLKTQEPDFAHAGAQGLEDHLVIIGYGINGRNVARAAKVAGIPYTIIEMNPETVRKEKSQGVPITYGDATSEAVLLHANIHKARVLVVAIPDPVATRRVIEVARKLNSLVHIIARTRFFQEMAPLYELGASEVIPEEFETSVEIFTRVLLKYLISPEKIEHFIAEVRSDGYQMFRSLSKEHPSLADLKLALPDIQINTLSINPHSTVTGKTLSEIDLRKKFGVTLLAIRRGGEILSNPSGNECLCAHDVLVLIGKPENMAQIAHLAKDKKGLKEH
jgi:Kef-type K+ transport system, predicted NAD-binding component